MNLKEAILSCNNYSDTEETMFSIFAKKVNATFLPESEAVILELSIDEINDDLEAIAKDKCLGFEYFMELFVMQDIFDDLIKDAKFKNDENALVDKIIYYAEDDE